MVNVYFYQQPKRDWKLVLKDLGVSSVGVQAKEDAKHYVRLSNIKGGKLRHITAVNIRLSDKNPDGPELHMTLH